VDGVVGIPFHFIPFSFVWLPLSPSLLGFCWVSQTSFYSFVECQPIRLLSGLSGTQPFIEFIRLAQVCLSRLTLTFAKRSVFSVAYNGTQLNGGVASCVSNAVERSADRFSQCYPQSLIL
jgi:hypothetical protein